MPAVFLEKYMSNLGIEAGSSITLTAEFALGVGIIEEGCKYLFFRRAVWNNPAFDEPMDGIVYCVMASMGFATLENIFYVIQSENSLGVAITRMVTAVPAHFTFAVMMGYFVGKAKFNPGQRFTLILRGIAIAAIFHGAYDFFLMQQYMPSIAIGAIVSLVIALVISRKAIKEHQADSKQFYEEQEREIND